MKIYRKILGYEIEFHTSARRRWTEFKVFRREWYTHVVWGRFSLIFGQRHLQPVTVCGYCNEELTSKSAGDESWQYCEGCETIEGPSVELTLEEYERLG